MAINNLIAKKIQKLDELCLIFCKATKIPYIECNPETFDDQAFAFANEEDAKEMLDKYKEEKKMILGIGKIPKQHIMPFITSLYAYGINALVYKDTEAVRVQLEELAPKPDIEKLKNEKVPKMNPDLQLTVAYFLQDVRRKDVERTQEERIQLHQMEEEMSVNLFRSRYIIGIDLTENGGKLDKEHPKFKLPFIKLQNGDTFVPCFSDFSEFQKFQVKNKEMKMSMLTVKYSDIKQFTTQSKGAVINPMGVNLVLSNTTIKKLQESYGE